MADPLRRIEWPALVSEDSRALLSREWLVTNGIGGYASGAVAGVMTRRYHGLLIAALGVPFGRTVMLSYVAERVRIADKGTFDLVGSPLAGGAADERAAARDTPDATGTAVLTEFRLEAGLPVWRYYAAGAVIEKRLFMPHGQNTVHVVYELLSGCERVRLALRPSMNFRTQEAAVSEPLGWPYEVRAAGRDVEIALSQSALPQLRLRLMPRNGTFTLEERRLDVLYPIEESRGYPARGELWSPGYFRVSLEADRAVALSASTESFETLDALGPPRALDAERGRRRRLLARAVPGARDGIGAELVLAADQFIITPVGRPGETVRARAAGDEVRTIIAGYHWFTDWGRDTMIALEGLTLVTGRDVEARYILRAFAHAVRDGLIPNLFPEGEREALYHAADATLWFFHALSRFVAYSNDRVTLAILYPTLKAIIESHLRGTRFGIQVDPRDGLLRQGAPGYQLTWMDAVVDDWVVTPRRGKAVEINALWYNALKWMEEWADGAGDTPGAREYRERAEQVAQSFNEKFWYGPEDHLFDVVDTDEGCEDRKCRPNQILAISLPHAVLYRERWEPVLRTVCGRLLTPVGLRSLAPDDPDFKSRYYGDLRARDAAYHQGTVWAWLVGPFVDAWLKVYPDDHAGMQRALDGFVPHLDDACVGSVSEVFDADWPFTPRGCIAQAWSVAELLRAWVKVARRTQNPWAIDSLSPGAF